MTIVSAHFFSKHFFIPRQLFSVPANVTTWMNTVPGWQTPVLTWLRRMVAKSADATADKMSAAALLLANRVIGLLRLVLTASVLNNEQGWLHVSHTLALVDEMFAPSGAGAAATADILVVPDVEDAAKPRTTNVAVTTDTVLGSASVLDVSTDSVVAEDLHSQKEDYDSAAATPVLTAVTTPFRPQRAALRQPSRLDAVEAKARLLDGLLQDASQRLVFYRGGVMPTWLASNVLYLVFIAEVLIFPPTPKPIGYGLPSVQALLAQMQKQLLQLAHNLDIVWSPDFGPLETGRDALQFVLEVY